MHGKHEWNTNLYQKQVEFMEYGINGIDIDKECNIVVARGADHYAALSTMIFLYGVNFLIYADKYNYTLWINYTNEYNNKYYYKDINKISDNIKLDNIENVFEYYYEGINPKNQGCNMKSSKIAKILSKQEIFPDLHYNMEKPYISTWYYKYNHHNIKINHNYYNESWYYQHRLIASKYVEKYFILRYVNIYVYF